MVRPLLAAVKPGYFEVVRLSSVLLIKCGCTEQRDHWLDVECQATERRAGILCINLYSDIRGLCDCLVFLDPIRPPHHGLFFSCFSCFSFCRSFVSHLFDYPHSCLLLFFFVFGAIGPVGCVSSILASTYGALP